MAMKLEINGPIRNVDAPPDLPLLWVLRDLVGRPGTKYGRGMARCGACSVHLDGKPVRACVTPGSSVGVREAVVLLEKNAQPSDVDIDAAMSGNICRCGTYQRVRGAIHLAARLERGGK